MLRTGMYLFGRSMQLSLAEIQLALTRYNRDELLIQQLAKAFSIHVTDNKAEPRSIEDSRCVRNRARWPDVRLPEDAGFAPDASEYVSRESTNAGNGPSIRIMTAPRGTSPSKGAASTDGARSDSTSMLETLSVTSRAGTSLRETYQVGHVWLKKAMSALEMPV